MSSVLRNGKNHVWDRQVIALVRTDTNNMTMGEEPTQNKEQISKSRGKVIKVQNNESLLLVGFPEK